MKVYLIIALCLTNVAHCICQTSKTNVKKPVKKQFTKSNPVFKCNTVVFDFSNNIDKHIADICYEVKLTAIIDTKSWSNEGGNIYRFNIIIDYNSKGESLKSDLPFIKYKETDKYVQYEYVEGDTNFKSLIFDKKEYDWKILLYENGRYILLSKTTQLSMSDKYHLLDNTFDILNN